MLCRHCSLRLLLFALFCSSAVFAQGLGKIVGTVTDPQGLGIASAEVTATQTGTGIKTTVKTDNSGLYAIPSLPPSQYSLTVSASGFETFHQSGIILRADQALSIDAHLQVGSATQEISVVANANQVDTATSTLEQVVDQKRIAELPLNGRNVAQLTTLVAGSISAPNDQADQGQTKTFPTVVTVSTNGSRANEITYMLDGGNNTDEYTNVNLPFPFPDSVQEFSVLTSDYSAQYGQNAGGVVNVITKSGTNQLHGDLFEYVRNGDLNARNFFAKIVDPLKRNQFGGTIGGPVVIPGVYNGHDKTFFFFGYQGTILRDMQGAQSAFVPTPANLQGDFSALLTATNPNNPLGKVVHIVNPFTGLPYPNNQIPVSIFDPAAVAFAKDLPTPSAGNGLVYYQKPLRQGFNEEVARIDHLIGSNDRITGRYYANRFSNSGIVNTANLLTFADQVTNLVQNALISETHTFTPSVLNVVELNYTREADRRGPPANSPDVNNFGVNIWQPSVPTLQSIAVSGFFSVGDNPSARFNRANWTFGDDVSWVRGSHTLNFGIHAELSRVDIDSQFQEPGAFGFTSDVTGYGLASFLLGYLRTFTQGSGQFFNNRNKFFGLYAEDSYRVTKRLTLNYGLRWEPYFPWRETKHRIEQFNPEAYAARIKSTIYPNAPAGLLFPGDPGVPEEGVRARYLDFEPRVGFAWDVTGDGKTSIRSGAGIFYDTRTMGGFDNSMSTLTPFSATVSLTQPKGTFSNPYLGVANLFPLPSPLPPTAAFPLPVTVVTFDPTGKWLIPTIYNWNFTIEHQLQKDTLVRASYVGSHSEHLFTGNQLNPAIYTPGSTLSTDQRRIFQPFSNITEAFMAANANYNSLQLSMEKRLSRGFSILANYTWSKALDTVPTGGSITGPSAGATYALPFYFSKPDALDIGPSDFDHRHRLVVSYLWQVPKIDFGGAFARAVLGNWQFTGIFQAQSGDEFTALAGVDQSQTGIGRDHAVLVNAAPYGTGACAAAAPCVNWLAPSSFGLPAVGTFGNLGKGSLHGPGLVDWDFGLFRFFPITERWTLQFRGEAFNILNHANFSDPISTVTAAGFGSINAAADPRILQLSAKLLF